MAFASSTTKTKDRRHCSYRRRRGSDPSSTSSLIPQLQERLALCSSLLKALDCEPLAVIAQLDCVLSPSVVFILYS